MALLSVVLPTYNEAGHIQEVLAQVAAACAGIDYEIVVVDDNSPDKTIEKVREAAAKDPRIVPVLRTTEKGLATAVIEGMRRSTGEFVVVMDSDFQHPPATVPKLLEAAQRENAEIVVASRYVPGGSAVGFPLTRRIISWGARTLAIVALPSVRHHHITDPMSGFFLVRRSAVDPDALRPRGYKILVEVIAKAHAQRATEVGFAFAERRGGVSKLRLKTQYDYFMHVLSLAVRDRENLRLLLFGLIGVTGIVVNYAVYEASKRFFHDPSSLVLLIPASIARETAILWNFAWNDGLTFRDLRARAPGGFFHRLLKFHLVSLISAVAYLALFYLLYDLGHIQDSHAVLLAIILTFFLNYSGNRRWTYAKRREAANG
jgi:dolichol-phosphate mannosyltransferase